jgi:hypothetical protein
LQRFLADEVAVVPQYIVVIQNVLRQGVAFALGHSFKLVRFHVSKAVIFHSIRQFPFFAVVFIDRSRGSRSGLPNFDKHLHFFSLGHRQCPFGGSCSGGVCSCPQARSRAVASAAGEIPFPMRDYV